MERGVYVKRLSGVCFAAGLALLLWAAYGLAGRFVPGLPGLEQGSSHVEAGEGASVPMQAAPALDYDVEGIVAGHIFGMPGQEKAATPDNAPQTKLQLSLVGSMSSPNESMARAMIAVNRGRISSYGVGERIDDTDAILHAIEPSRVLIERNGRFESLLLKRQLIADLAPAASGK